jgi:hypothetical protein
MRWRIRAFGRDQPKRQLRRSGGTSKPAESAITPQETLRNARARPSDAAVRQPYRFRLCPIRSRSSQKGSLPAQPDKSTMFSYAPLTRAAGLRLLPSGLRSLKAAGEWETPAFEKRHSWEQIGRQVEEFGQLTDVRLARLAFPVDYVGSNPSGALPIAMRVPRGHVRQLGSG